MIAHAKPIRKRNVLVYTDPNSIGAENDSIAYLVEAVRGNPGYKVIEVYEEKPKLALHFDIVLCRLNSPRFLESLIRIMKKTNIPIYTSSSLPKQERNHLEILAELGIAPENIMETGAEAA